MSSFQNNLNHVDYEFLIKSLTEGNYITKAETLKRFNVLVATDKKQFAIHAKRIVLAIQDLMFEAKEDINLLASNLALEVINLNPRQIQYYIRSKLLRQIVKNLGDEKAQIRKTSHYCLMSYVKTYKSFDEVFQVYLSVGIQAEEWQLRQKAINSLQSILIMEMKYLNWASNQFKKVFETLLSKLNDESIYVQKAVEQCLISLCKMDELRSFSKKLSPQILQQLKSFCQKQIEAGNLHQMKLENEDKKTNFLTPIKLVTEARQQSMKNLPNSSILNLQKIKFVQQNSQKKAIINMIEEMRRNNTNTNTPNKQKDEVDTLRKAQSLLLSHQIKQMRKKTSAIQKISQLKLQPIKRQLPTQKERGESPSKAERQAAAVRKLVEDLKNDKDWKVRLEAIQQLQTKFEANREMFDLESLNKTYIPILVKLLGDGNFKVALISLKIIEELLVMPNMNLDQLVPHLTQRLSDNKIALRQNVSKLIISEYIKTKKTIWIEALLNQLKKSSNSNTKEQILTILTKLYELKQPPNFSMNKVIEAVCPLMDDLKTKIKIKTLDILVLISLKAHNIEEVKNLLITKLNQVYYEMYCEKLVKEIKNKKKQSIQANISTDQSDPSKSLKTGRALTLQSKRYTKNSGNTTSTSLQRDKNTKLDPKDTVRTSSFIQKAQKNDMQNRASEQLENINSKISLNESDMDKSSKSPQRKKSFLKSFKKRNYQSSNYQSTNYSTGEDLEPFNEPQKELKKIQNQIKSNDWEICYQALNKLRRIVAHHSQLLNQTVIKVVVPQIMKLVENLRSSLSKNAVVTLNQLASKVKKGLDSELDLIFNKLIKKSLDTNSFISEEVKKVLVTVCSSCNESKVINLLNTAHTSRAIPIKQMVTHILENISFLPKIYEKEIQKVVIILNNFMSEGSLEIRQKTKSILTQILSSEKGKQVMKLISDQHLNKIKKQIDEKVPELKYHQKQQSIQDKKQIQIPIIQQQIKKKKKNRINSFPEEFDQVESLLEKCESSDWKVRLQSMNETNQIFISYPNQASQHRLNTKFIDVLSKQIGDPNVKVATNALRIFKNLISVIPSLIQNNLSVISNEVFNCFASQKVEVKTSAEQFFDELCVGIQSWMLVQHMCNGILYGVQKSKPIIVEKLINIVPSAIKAKPNIFQKNVYPMLNKVTEQGKLDLMQGLKKLTLTICEETEESCLDYLKPRVKQLIKS